MAASAAKRAKTTLTFVTGNPNKLKEVKAILGDSLPFLLTSQAVELPELQGEPDDIAKEKCRLAMEEIRGPVITEDTCLGFRALNGLPGPYIKWFLTKIGHQGLNNLLAAYEDKSADAVCTFAYGCGDPKGPIMLFKGVTAGKIVPARGPNDFGWDPVFQPHGFNETYAEMEQSVKNAISHRYKALVALRDHFLSDQPPSPRQPSTDPGSSCSRDRADSQTGQ